MSKPRQDSGKLRIGDDWNAITIIALSQSNPLKAVAEFVENSIDANARNIVITRGKEKGAPYLRIADDGDGIPRDAEGRPDFHYVATHICDSIKRRLRAEGARGLQGEFGIGLLSFWTLGEQLTLTSSGADGRTYQMHMRKGDPNYRVTRKHTLLPGQGTELVVRHMLPGIRQVSGDKIQWYLASELRDRIRHSGARIRVVDRTARAEYRVEPRQFEGRLLHQLHRVAAGQGGLYLEVYLNGESPENRVGLYRGGTRVLADIAELDLFHRPPWTSGFLQGIVDAEYLRLTPGTRQGVIHDETLDRLREELAPVEAQLLQFIMDQQRAEEERTSREVLRSIQNALKEALLALPAEEYDWFNLHRTSGNVRPAKDATRPADGDEALVLHEGPGDGPEEEPPQLQFFEHAGPLFSARISPASSVVPTGSTRALQAVARDRSRRRVERDLRYAWQILEGDGRLDPADGEIATFHAGIEPGLIRIGLEVAQDDIRVPAEALVTVTDSLLPMPERDRTGHGIPGYTFEKAPGQLWRSRFDPARNVIVINNGHRDFVHAARAKALKLRYICRLYAKELVLRNFPGVPQDQLLERLIELTLYTEEHLR